MTEMNDFNQGVIAEFDAQVAIMPFFADYQVKAGDRLIPVLRLVRN